ncbi:MAG: cytochrome P450 [Alphaproteobacteria bacterium]
MTLQPVTETFQRDVVGLQPENAPVYPAQDGPSLAEMDPFRAGQPFDLYAKLRENAPVAWYDVPFGQGFWAVTRYEDIKHVELNPQIFSSQKGGINMTYGEDSSRFPRLLGASLNTLICLDRPHHIELRMQHRDFFTPQYVAELRKKVEKKVDSLCDDLERQGPKADFVKIFSEQLPLFTLSEMLGIPEKDRPKIVRWMHYLESTMEMAAKQQRGERISLITVAKFLWNIRQMFTYGEREMKKLRVNPRDDLMSVLATATLDDELLAQEFLDGAWLLIIFAGNDTTRNSLSGSLRLLKEFPEQKQRLLDDPSLIPGAVPEILRMVSPVIHMRRTLTQDTELAGQKMKEGEKVMLWYGAGNRDESVFENPNQFDVTRENARDHIAFGHGPHVCLGQRIAMMQLEVAVTKLLERFPNIEWTGKQTIAANNFVSAVTSLEVDLGTGR